MSERKPDDQRVNRNPRVYPTTYIVWDGKTRGPEIPEGEWTDQAKEWWEFVRNSPQAMLMQPSDWEQMKVALRLYDGMFSKRCRIDKRGNVNMVDPTPGELRSLAAEFRTYTETYGFTRQSRIKYGINIVTAEELETEAVQAQLQANPEAAIVDYRKRLGGSQ